MPRVSGPTRLLRRHAERSRTASSCRSHVTGHRSPVAFPSQQRLSLRFVGHCGRAALPGLWYVGCSIAAELDMGGWGCEGYQHHCSCRPKCENVSMGIPGAFDGKRAVVSVFSCGSESGCTWPPYKRHVDFVSNRISTSCQYRLLAPLLLGGQNPFNSGAFWYTSQCLSNPE